ncbi:hypothetical protein DFJ43DRAFT_1099049 [Lentinula guzmanii]|uniref:Secreted protein n=1 Tax=Lentinula guzmanii TaxID=2804957 RepID=A0AA38MWB1_9AGAR|nr:hypothetical protein DFJ43DRAFT_1099049 [Lentinula guzmanii]
MKDQGSPNALWLVSFFLGSSSFQLLCSQLEACTYWPNFLASHSDADFHCINHNIFVLIDGRLSLFEYCTSLGLAGEWFTASPADGT